MLSRGSASTLPSAPLAATHPPASALSLRVPVATASRVLAALQLRTALSQPCGAIETVTLRIESDALVTTTTVSAATGCV